MGHVSQKLTFGNTGLLRLKPHLLDLVNIGLYIGHIQDQDHASLLPAVFVHDTLAVAFIMPPVKQKTLRGILVQHFLAKILQHPDIFPQLMGRQAGEDICRRHIIADQPIMVIQ